MNNYLEQYGSGIRRLAGVVCLAATLLCTTATAVMVALIGKQGLFDPEGRPLWIGAVVWGLLALASGWMSLRLLFGQADNAVTFLPVWFVQLAVVFFLAGMIWVWIDEGKIMYESLFLGMAGTAWYLRRTVRMRSHHAEKKSESDPEPELPEDPPRE